MLSYNSYFLNNKGWYRLKITIAVEIYFISCDLENENFFSLKLIRSLKSG